LQLLVAEGFARDLAHHLCTCGLVSRGSGAGGGGSEVAR